MAIFSQGTGFQFLQDPVDLGRLGCIPEGPVVDANGHGRHPDAALPGGDGGDRPAARHSGVRQEGLEAVGEVPPVAHGLETHEVVLEEILQELFPPGQFQEDVRGWEGDMEEKDAVPLDPR